MPFAIDRSQAGVMFTRIPFFQTVALMRSVNVQGYPFVGLFGTSSVNNGLFFFDEDDSGTDDGVNVIKPDYVSGNGRWKRYGRAQEGQRDGVLTAYAPGAIAANTTTAVTATIPGAAVGDKITVTPPATLNAGLMVGHATITAPTTATIRIGNFTAGIITPTGADWTYVLTDLT